MNSKVDHFAFRVSNLKASIEFYCHTLGLKLLSKTVDKNHHEAFAFIELDGGNLELLQLLNEDNMSLTFEKPEVSQPFCPHLALASADLDELVLFLQRRNIEIVKGPLEISETVKWLYIADPDNNIVEFVQWVGR